MTTAKRTATLLKVAATSVPRRRLICIPFAGGGAGAFRWWRRSLPADTELMVVELPGREARLREPPFDAIPDIVAAVAPAILGHTELPYALFGHSMGALVAYELTLALEASGVQPPSRLFVSARRAPDEADLDPPMDHLPDDKFLDELQRRYDAVPEAVRQEPDLLALLLPALRADIRALERYSPSSTRPVQCPIVVYGGTEDRHPMPAQLPGWQRVAAGPVRVRLFSGGHFYLSSHVADLTADIVDCWQDACVERT